MKLFFFSVIAAFLVLYPVQDARAMERETETKSVEVEPAPTPTGIPGHVLKLLNGTGASRAGTDALKAFYGKLPASSVWVDENGPTPAGKAAHAEIARADDYGLDPGDFALPSLDGAKSDPEQLARIELQMSRAVLLYARHAGGARVKPGAAGSQLRKTPPLPDPADVLERISSESDPAAYLRSLHPAHPQFEALRQRLLTLRKAKDEKTRAAVPKGPVLRKGTSHEHVALLRKRLAMTEAKGDARKFDAAVEAAVKKFQRDNALSSDGVVGAGTRRALNGNTSEAQLVKILINMERWRWLPAEMGAEAGIYVWANIPEYRVRIVRKREIVFSERVIVGKVDKQTPVFSDKIEWIEFHPTWYVPNSIKVDDILPSLRRPTSQVMKRYHLRLNCGRHGSNPATIDWNSVDIRKCSVSQPPGAKSVLGDFKFKFPNKHDVYMHDTPTKRLFSRTTRTFSHGCVRIRNPRRMAEILLEHDKQMSSTRVAQILAGPRSLHKEDLNRHVPVHITYFTAIFDDKDTFLSRPDIYGHDKRLAQALLGKGHLLPLPAITVRTARKKKRKPAATSDNWWQPSYLQN